jgi:hypothetical protein
VQIFHAKQERLHLTLLEQEAPYALNDSQAALGEIEGLPLKILNAHVQESQ